MPTFLESLEGFSPSWLLGELSGGFMGVFALVGDSAAEAFSQALMMPWLLEPTSPPDATPLIGKEQRMPRYPNESLENYRIRLWDAWSAYAFGGSKTAIELQLAQAGFPGKVLYGGPDKENDYYSQFWVWFPQGTHTVTDVAPKWGAFQWGDGTKYGPVGITTEQLAALKDLITKWKHSQWICRSMIFEISGWLYGTGHKWGEPGLVWGGKSASVRI